MLSRANEVSTPTFPVLSTVSVFHVPSAAETAPQKITPVIKASIKIVICFFKFFSPPFTIDQVIHLFCQVLSMNVVKPLKLVKGYFSRCFVFLFTDKIVF